MSDTNLISKKSYTSKDFNTIYPELLDLVKKLTYKWDPSISNESDPGVILIKLNALIADKCNYNSDKNVLETFPMTVTQESNARQLYEQLGYYMHWYESALSTVYISMNAPTLGYSDTDYCEIPPFTTVSDDEGNIVYTLLGTSGMYTPTQSNKVYFNNSSVAFDAIQGIPVIYDINGNTTITTANLDDDNRIYFSNNDIAQNGIFICNVGEGNYLDWKRLDNLHIESLNKTIYRFGVLPNSEICYLEFPEDAENIFREGIEITYIKTLADDGVIPAFYLEKFFSSPTVKVSTGDTITLDTSNTVLSNISSSVGGKNKESVSEAYRGYKTVVGTFNTLVTLRDYINAAINSGLCSNNFITDRTDDIQNQYSIVSNIDNTSTIISNIEKDSLGNNKLNAFNLKLYLLQYVAEPIDSAVKYLKTFSLQTDSELDLFKKYIEDQKSISHDYVSLETPSSTQSHFCLFKNKYPLTVRIIPKYSLSSTESENVAENVRKSIYKTYNAKLVDFGKGVNLSDIRSTIIDADNRISDASVYSIEYKTYAIYWNGEKFREVALDSEESTLVDISSTSYISRVTPVDGFAIKQFIKEYDSDEVYYKDYVVSHSGSYYICDDDAISGSWTSSYWSEIEDYVPNTLYDIDQPVFYKSSVYRLIANDADPSSGGTAGMSYFVPEHWQRVEANYINEYTWKYLSFRYTNSTWQIRESVDDDYVDLDENINNYFEYEGVLSDGDVVVIEVSPSNQFKNEIYVKSILAGKTPLFIEDTSFDYDINHGLNGAGVSSPIDNIEKIKTNVDINITNVNNEYLLRENESLQFFAPNLIDSTTYSNYTKYDGNITADIPSGTNYELRPGEYIGLYWKDSERDEAIYQYCVYGEGNIICPSFTLSAQSPATNSLGVAPTTVLWNRKINVSRSGDTQYMSSSVLTEDMTSELSSIIESNVNSYLSGSKKLIAKSINQVKLSEGMRMYWALNNSIDNSFTLFNDASSIREYNPSLSYDKGDFAAYTTNGDAQIWECLVDNTTGAWDQSKWTLSEYSQRILNSGEYVFYMNNDLTVFNILGAGTRIIRANDYSKWSVDVVSLETINNFGASSLVDFWFYPSVGVDVLLQEQQFYNISNGSTVKLTNNNNDAFDITFTSDTVTDLSNFTISYATVSEPVSSDFVNLPGIDTTNSNKGTWSCRSSLYINSGPGKEQILLSNQSVEVFQKTSNNRITIDGADFISTSPANYPVVMQFASEVNTQSMSGDIYVTTLDNNGDIVYNKLYVYSTYSNTDGVKYSSFGGASIYFTPTAGVAQTVSFTFSAPEVEDFNGYLLQLYNPYAEDIVSLTATLNGAQIADFASGNTQFKNSGTYYLDLGKLNTSTTSQVVITATFASNAKKVITISHLFKYKVADEIVDSGKYNIYDYLIKNVFDIDHLYDYTYTPASGKTFMYNPLLPENFFESDHIFNKFTIPQADLNNFIVTVPQR